MPPKHPLVGILAILTLLAVMPGTAGAQSSPPEVPVVIRGLTARRIDDLLTRSAAFGWSGQALVVADGQLVLHQAYGIANRAAQIPMMPTTRVGIASMSKMVTAAAVLHLVQSGKLRLDARLGDVLPNVPSDKVAITVHQLLTHTAGIRGGDIAGDFELASQRDLIDRILAQPLAAAPGEEWSYANSGYSLLAAVVESVSGVPYDEGVRRDVLQPAGMSQTGFWHEQRPEDELAHAYIGLADEGDPSGWERNWRVFGAGGLVSTAADLYRFDQALQNGTLLSRRMFEAMTTRQATIDDELGFGYALFIHGSADGLVHEHSGDWQRGYNGAFFRYAAEDHLIVLTNNARDQAGQWMRHHVGEFIERMIRGEDVPESRLPPVTRPLSPSDRRDLPGTYLLNDGSRVIIVDDGSYVWIAPEGVGATALIARADSAEQAATDLATARSMRLLASLTAGDVDDGFATALGEDGARHLPDYVAEWEDLVAERGRLLAFTLYGSALAGGGARTLVRLQQARGTTDYQLFWSRRGEGRLMGTLVRPSFFPPGYVAALVVRTDPDGELVAYDLFRERAVRLHLERAPDGSVAALVIGPDLARAVPETLRAYTR